ncbi:aldo/keto reductase [Pseudemcibacter aquimaris]|uniref:aldo/keto reductase n=1 Tax=Pseudemcibacter aquimaris TaxID=2857064 RepID=UPI002012C503|nr:aldo/keto reductase [Pseudemcibacter aquimaris]MCC3861926.1 aldo/keto reductase [Pseudemcibacter aquimaris]WDU58678.1 aldo/keto reductase [Pseudemcibacter aquimaris]
MEYRPLGRTDLKVSNICLGTMTWGRQNTEIEAHEQLDYAIGKGINFIDTAELYAVPSGPEYAGQTEKIIGNWLSKNGNRDELIIASKVAGYSTADWLRDGEKETRLNRDQMTYALENSLKRLGTDYIDVYYTHWPDRKIGLFKDSFGYNHIDDPDAVPIEETMEVLNDFVKSGKVRHVAISNETPWGAMQYLNSTGPRVGLIQNAYSLVNRLFEHGLAEFSMRENMGLAAYSPLAAGVLSGKYVNGALPKGSRRELFPEFTTRYSSDHTSVAVEKYYNLAREHGLTLTALAQKFVDTRPFVTTSIIGATSMDQLKENIDAFDIKWNDELEEQVNKIHRDNPSPAP